MSTAKSKKDVFFSVSLFIVLASAKVCVVVPSIVPVMVEVVTNCVTNLSKEFVLNPFQVQGS